MGHRERASKSLALVGHFLGRLETEGVFFIQIDSDIFFCCESCKSVYNITYT